MKGSTNAMRGSADVVQSTSAIKILDATLQNSTDSQPGLMSAADHQQMTTDHATLSTTVSRLSTCESGLAGKQDKLTFDTEPVEGSSNPITSGGVYTAINNNNSVRLCKIYCKEYITFDLSNFTTEIDSTNKPFFTRGSTKDTYIDERCVVFEQYPNWTSTSTSYACTCSVNASLIPDEIIIQMMNNLLTIEGPFSTDVKIYLWSAKDYGSPSIYDYAVHVDVQYNDGSVSYNITKRNVTMFGPSPSLFRIYSTVESVKIN